MQFVALLAAIETEFEIEFPIEIMEVNTFDDFFNILNESITKKEI